tara:strand:+ start:106 stop:1332 length:1227 start_codon:yes stop_codon:yes gene_type:complete
MIKPTNYIGFHVGDIDDEYIASSEHPEWEDIYNNSNKLDCIVGDEPISYQAFAYEYEYDYETNNMQRTIIEYGTKEDMYNLERDLHNKYDVGVSDKYFNLVKSGGAYKTIQVDYLEELRERILKGEFTTDLKESIEDLYNELIPKRLQNRTSEDVKFVRDIAKDIKGEESTEYCEPIRVKINKDGTRTMFDGNTTLMGAYSARKQVKDGSIQVDEVPYEISKQFTDDEFDELGVLMNKRPKVRKRPATKEDVAARIWKRFMNDHTPIKDKKNKEYIQKTGHRTTDVYAIVNSWFQKGGHVGTYINYQLEHNKKKLDSVVKKATNVNTKVFKMTSAKFRDEDVNQWLGENTNFGNRKPEKNKLLIVIHHPNSVAETKWDDAMAQKKKEIKYLARLTGVDFIGFKYMDTH